MADKEKRIQKFLNKIHLKGKLKSVKTLEEASIVIIRDPHAAVNSVFYDKVGYQTVLSRGETFPEDRVYFLTPTNPRNNDLVMQGILFKTYGFGVKPFKSVD